MTFFDDPTSPSPSARGGPAAAAATERQLSPRRGRVTPARMLLCLATIAACVPYLSLKIMWILGLEIGVVGPGFIEDTRAANVVTASLDLCAAFLAVLFVHSVGRRVPAWIVGVPVWVATGLLTPVVGGVLIGFPMQAVIGETSLLADAGGLNGWVFMVVYGGFILQAALLLPAFVLYAADRWPAVFRTCADGDVPDPNATERILAGAFLVGAVIFAAVFGYGAIAGGGLFGDPEPTQRVSQGVFAGLALVGAAAFVRLRSGVQPSRGLLVAAWVGSGVVFTESLIVVMNLLLTPVGSDRIYGPAGSLMWLLCLLCALSGAIFGMRRLESTVAAD